MHDHHQFQETTNVLWLSLELLLIAALISAIVMERTAWQRHPVLTALSALLFLAGMYPAFDAVARQSVWLHSLQSLMIHHLAPLLLLLAGINPCRVIPGSSRILTSTSVAVLVLFSFTAMTLFWLSPDLHVPLMENPALYSLMKWGMALSGILLCSAIGWQSSVENTSILRGIAFSLAIAAPQAAAGIYLIRSPPLYPMPGCLNPPVSWLPLLDAAQDQRLGGSLLIAASAIFFLGDLVGRLRPVSQALHATTRLPQAK